MIKLTVYPPTIAVSMDLHFTWHVGTDNVTIINRDDLYLKYPGNEITKMLYSETHLNRPGEEYDVDAKPTISEISGDPERIDIIVLHNFNGFNSEYVDIVYSRVSKGTYYVRSVSPVQQARAWG